MQFQYNSDYPTVDPATGQEIVTPAQAAQNPTPFPTAQPLACASLTTRVWVQQTQQITTVSNVLVRVGGALSQNTVDEDENDLDLDDASSSSSDASMMAGDTTTSNNYSTQALPDRAYWIQRTLREAIYGKVMLAIVLERADDSVRQKGVEWRTTTQFCAVKEMSWGHIRKERDRLAEDPVKEVASMQYLRSWYQQEEQVAQDPVQAMMNTNIMMPLDLLSDERCLYSIMPFCDGGELFDRLDSNDKFSEQEARYWMRQVLNGLEYLQRAGICHRDMSLENLLLHQQTGALIIDMGMCLRIPYNASRRCLLTPQGTCGKWIYMSPEIYKSKEPFDGHAVDLWAAGVILFLMLTGFPPWERACPTDDRFKYMSGGYLVQMLTEWRIPISPDAMDLLQRMLFVDPKDRLSLAQVRAHPWMMAE